MKDMLIERHVDRGWELTGGPLLGWVWRAR